MRNTREIKQAANEALARASYSPGKLILLYAGISAGVLLLFTLFTFFLQTQISQTGGLGGIGLRSVLSTIDTVLTVCVNFVLPILTMGYLSAALCMVRGNPFSGSTLLDGFRHIGASIRFMILKTALFFLPAIACLYPAMMIFLLTPLSAPLEQALLPILSETADMEALLNDPAVIAAVEACAIPAVLIFLALYLLVSIPLFYRARLADLALMENPKAGAFAALRKSFALTRNNCKRLIKLDLGYWWYYLLSGVVAGIVYADALLPLFGISLPMDAKTTVLVFYVLYLVAEFALRAWMLNRVQVSYILLYDDLIPWRPVHRFSGHTPWEV